MSIERYLDDLAAALPVRGRAARRLRSETREHLRDAAEVHGDAEAVRRFGPADALAAAYGLEIGCRRARTATAMTTAGVVAVALSTLVVVNSATGPQSAVVAWAVLFFAAAQCAGVCLTLAGIQAVAMSRTDPTPAEVALLCRRNLAALGWSLLTLVAAAGAVSGSASAAAVLGGPVVALLAVLVVLHARRLVRRLPGARPWLARSPLPDLAALVRWSPGVARSAGWLLAAALVIAPTVAYLWDLGDHGTTSSAAISATIEAALVIAGFVALGPLVGLWSRRTEAETGVVSS